MKEGRREGQVMAENEGKGVETNTWYKETIKERNRREDDAWMKKRYSNGGPRQCDRPARRMVDCGRDNVSLENKMYIGNNWGGGGWRRKCPMLGARAISQKATHVLK